MSEQTITLDKLTELINKGKSSSAIQREVIHLRTAFAQRVLIYKTKSVNTMLNEIFRNSRSVRSIPVVKSDPEHGKQDRISCYSLRFNSLKSIKAVSDQADEVISFLKTLYDELEAPYTQFTDYTEPRNVRVVYQTYEMKVFYETVTNLDKMMMMMDYLRMMGAIDEVTEKEKTKQVTGKIEEMLRKLLVISDRIVRERKNKFPKIKNKEGRNIPDRKNYPSNKGRKKPKKKTNSGTQTQTVVEQGQDKKPGNQPGKQKRKPNRRRNPDNPAQEKIAS